MTAGTAWAIAFVVCIWIGWPLHSIADELRKLRRMAERGRHQ